jgi:hypothetical protein
MAKHLCKLSESVKKNFETIAALVDRPRFVCTDCGRAANEKKRLCEPKRLPGQRRNRPKKDSPKTNPASDK